MADRLSILAVATPEEVAAIRLAAERMSVAVGESGGPVIEVLTGTAGRADLSIASLLPEAETDGGWPATSRRLREQVAGLRRRAGRVYLCTIFRHAPGPDARVPIASIRKLNLLALELSRELGVFVVDVDRALADAGARSFETDYRLQGPLAAEAVAREIVVTLVATGFEAAFSREAQVRLKALLEGWSPAWSAAWRDAPASAVNDRRARTTSALGGALSSSDAQAALALRQLARGQMSLREGFGLAARMVRERGLMGSLTIAMRGARQVLGL